VKVLRTFFIRRERLKKNPVINLFVFTVASVAVFLFLHESWEAGAQDVFIPSGAPVYTYRIVHAYPHDPGAFTQGLFYHGGYLYESTGLQGRSSLRKVDLKTGRVLKIRNLPKKYFGEGITLHGKRIFQITWQSKTGFIYDPETFRRMGQFSYDTEGWGVTSDGIHLIMSDGTSTLRVFDTRTFRVSRKIEVKDRGGFVSGLNELEYVKGEIYANIWNSGYIARISPETGEIRGWIDLRGLYSELGGKHGWDVLNGIAYDPERDRLFVTGKFWPKLFEIKIII
jgi:glutaminyl-peptide cyclotransferase